MKIEPGFSKISRFTFSFSLAAVLSSLLASSPLAVFADAPPGSYLESTTQSQSKKGSVSVAAPASAQSQGNSPYGRPLGDSLDRPASSSPSSSTWSSSTIEQQPNPFQQQPPQGMGAVNQQPQYGQPQQQNWAGQPNSAWQNQAPQQQNQPAPQMQGDQASPGAYSGFAQQNSYAPPPQNYSAPPPNYAPPQAAGGPQWQADYPSMNEMNGGAPNAPPQYGQAQAAPPQNPWAFQQQPPPVVQPKQTVAKSAPEEKEPNGTLTAIANTVLPMATSVVTTAIMNKMMYGSMTPGYGGGYPGGGYGNGYGNSYGGMRNPMGGYGYGRPSLLNGIMGGGAGGLLNNMHF